MANLLTISEEEFMLMPVSPTLIRLTEEFNQDHPELAPRRKRHRSSCSSLSSEVFLADDEVLAPVNKRSRPRAASNSFSDRSSDSTLAVLYSLIDSTWSSFNSSGPGRPINPAPSPADSWSTSFGSLSSSASTDLPVFHNDTQLSTSSDWFDSFIVSSCSSDSLLSPSCFHHSVEDSALDSWSDLAIRPRLAGTSSSVETDAVGSVTAAWVDPSSAEDEQSPMLTSTPFSVAQDGPVSQFQFPAAPEALSLSPLVPGLRRPGVISYFRDVPLIPITSPLPSPSPLFGQFGRDASCEMYETDSFFKFSPVTSDSSFCSAFDEAVCLNRSLAMDSDS